MIISFNPTVFQSEDNKIKSVLADILTALIKANIHFIDIKSINAISKNDRNPANIILRLSSEFEENKNKKQINNFIQTSPIEILYKHFITQEMVDLYKQNRIDDFISKRQSYLKLKEKEFVVDIGLQYTN